MALGDESVYVVATTIWRNRCQSLLVFVVISVMGFLEWLVLGWLFVCPFFSAQIIDSVEAQLRQVTPNYQLSVASSAARFCLIYVLGAVHCVVMKKSATWWYGYFRNRDCGELLAVFGVLLCGVSRWQQGHIESMLLVISPILAALGSLMVVFGGMQNPLFLPVCLPICALVLLAYFYSRYLHSR